MSENTNLSFFFRFFLVIYKANNLAGNKSAKNTVSKYAYFKGELFIEYIYGMKRRDKGATAPIDLANILYIPIKVK